jgi:hypothetical protein
MDANGQRFTLYAQPGDFAALDDVVWQPAARVLTLARERAAPVEADRALLAEERLARVPAVRDGFGQLARWDSTERMLRSEHGALVVESATPEKPTDLALDADQVLLMALPGQVRLVDLRSRFEPIRLPAPLLPGGEAFLPFKLACSAQGGRWVLDRRHGVLAKVTGRPWRRRALVDFQPDTFRPHPENPHEPALELSRLQLPAGEDFVAIACSAAGRLAVGSWGPRGVMLVRVLQGTELGPPRELLGAQHGHALRWLDERLLAVWAGQLGEALVYDLDEPGLAPIELQGRRYPLRRAEPGQPPVQGQAWPPHYLLQAGDQGGPQGLSRPLVPLSWRAQATRGRARLARHEAASFDSCWHRLNVEAELPSGCAVLVELAARDDETTPEDAEYHPHWLGDPALMPAHLPRDTPRAALLRAGSELPLHPGLLPAPSAGTRSGCFTVLLQRAGRSDRSLRGRWLHGRIMLFGNGQRAPCVAALRVWGERFSYASHYLPALYHDDEGRDRAEHGPASPQDFLERFTQLFESELTRWEDLAANAHVLTSPHSCPQAALPWLAGLMGQALPPALPPQAARAWLVSAPERTRLRGTLGGLKLALDVALEGAVTRGAVIVLEDFRLRRTLATLLGVDLSQPQDPLLPGLHGSANSRVGDALILGEGEVDRRFLAAFLPEALAELEGDTSAQASTEDFYARTTHRATVLLHEDLPAPQRRLAEAIVALESPAHVAVRLLDAQQAFMVGVASLVGVDSFLRAPTAPGWATVDQSLIGRGDRILGGSLFDSPHSSSGGAMPMAVLEGPEVVSLGQSFALSAERSRADDSRELIRFRWTRL